MGEVLGTLSVLVSLMKMSVGVHGACTAVSDPRKETRRQANTTKTQAATSNASETAGAARGQRKQPPPTHSSKSTGTRQENREREQRSKSRKTEHRDSLS